MSIVTHKILLHSDQRFGNRLPPRHLGQLLSEIPLAVRQSISMALRNRSTGRGRQPIWLDQAADIRFVEHEGNEETILYFEAPTLGEAAAELYKQQEFWPSRPDAEDTGFDLLGDVLADITGNNADSEHFDPPLLKRMVRFKKVLAGPFREVSLITRRYNGTHPARITPATIQAAESFCSTTPASQRVRVVGQLDMIRVSTQTFALHLEDGQEVRGSLPDGMIEECKSLLNRRVLVLGRSVYRASGRLLRIDAEMITNGEHEPSIWSRIPEARGTRLDLSKVRKPQGPRSGMAAIMGRWPGDETDEEIQEALERLS